MDEKKIIEITIKSEQAIARAVELEKEIQNLNKQVSELDKSSKNYNESEKVLTATIKAHKQELQTLSREMMNTVKQEKEQLGYIQKLEAEVSNLTLKYKQLSEAELRGAKGQDTLKLLTTKREELSQLNMAYGNHTMEVGNYSKATASLNMQMAQLLREAPNFAISMRIGIMSLTNNLPFFFESMKAVKTELNDLKASGAKTPSMFSQIVKSMLGFNGIVAVGILLLQLFGEKAINWIGSLFKGKDAIEKLSAAQMGLKSSTEIINDTFKKGGGEYGKAVEEINKHTVALKTAKGNHELTKKALDDYNKSLGVTFGKASDVNTALGLIDKNKTAYINAMRDMSIANAFFSKSAEDAVKVVEIQSSSNAQVLGENAKQYIKSIEDAYKPLKDKKISKEYIDEMRSIYRATGEVNDQRLQGLFMAEEKYNNVASAERTRQVGMVQKHSDDLLKGATDYYSKYSKIVAENEWNITEETKTQTDKKVEISKDGLKKLEEDLALYNAQHTETTLESATEVARRENEISKTKYNLGLISKTVYDTEILKTESGRLKSLEGLAKEEIDKLKENLDYKKALGTSTAAEMASAEYDIAYRQYELNLVTYEQYVINKKAIDDKYKVGSAGLTPEQDAQLKLDATIQGSMAEMNAKLAILELEKQKELSVAGTTEEQKLLIKKKYATAEKQLRLMTMQSQLETTSSAIGQMAGLFSKGSKAGKAVASAQVAVDAIRGAMAAYSSAQALPFGLGIPVGIAAAAGVIATGARNIKSIWAVNESGTTSVNGGGTSTPDTASKMAAPLSTNVANISKFGGAQAITTGIAGNSNTLAVENATTAAINANTSIPTPIVSVQEINRVQRSVQVIEKSSTY